jgi:sulfur-oxidizing protein SoxX
MQSTGNRGARGGATAFAAALAAAFAWSGAAAEGPVAYRVEGDGIVQSLTATPGDPARGREILMGRDGNCLLCHAAPETGARFMGNLAPPLSGVGARLTAAQMRLRIADSLRLDPETIMPSYHRVEGLRQVAAGFRGKPILTAQQVEDTIAYLLTLR